MALGCSGSGSQDIRRSANIPLRTNFSMCGWFRITAYASNFAVLLGIDSGAGSNWTFMQTTNTNEISVGTSGGGFAFATTPAIGVPFFAALSCSGTGSETVKGYWRYGGDKAFVVTSGVGQSGSNNVMYALGSSFGTSLNGVVDQVRAWDAVLSPAEFGVESLSLFPVRRQNLNSAPNCAVISDLRDLGPNAYRWTKTGTLTDQRPLPGGRRMPMIPRAPLGKGSGAAAVDTSKFFFAA